MFRDYLRTLVCISLADALVNLGERQRADEAVAAGLTGIEQWAEFFPRQAAEHRAELLAIRASLLDPASAVNAAERSALITRASTLLLGADSEGRITLRDRRTLARLAALGAASAPDVSSKIGD
ncbi:MAG: hypothetical protein QM691_05590 [Opitutaceae bacterium]